MQTLMITSVFLLFLCCFKIIMYTFLKTSDFMNTTTPLLPPKTCGLCNENLDGKEAESATSNNIVINEEDEDDLFGTCKCWFCFTCLNWMDRFFSLCLYDAI